MTQGSGRRARFPVYSFVCLAVIVCAQALVYCGTNLVLPQLTAHVLTGPLDARIPFSAPWVTVYLLCFPYWLIAGLLICSGEKSLAYRIAAAYVAAMLLSGAAFLLWPGTMERPEVTGGGVFNALVRFVYRVDEPTNLCPSLHVLATWFCIRGALENKGISRRYKVFSAVCLVLVCCSVLLVKQHAVVDVPAGILVGELSLQLGRVLRLERVGFAIENAIKK